MKMTIRSISSLLKISFRIILRLYLRTMVIMTTPKSPAELIIHPETQQFICKGAWSILFLNNVLNQLQQKTFIRSRKVSINGQDISNLDSAGALALLQLRDSLVQANNSVEFIFFDKEQQKLIHLLDSKKEAIHFIPTSPLKHSALNQLGRETVHKLQQIDGLIALIGSLSDKLIAAASSWKRLQIPSLVSNINTTGIQALPIISLLSFLIGVVLAYQMGLQLETYGANSFIAFLSGMACFREFAPLITAIIVAGRTSSAFTAQIGSMKINEEIDALETMGLSPVELLVLPKLLGLMLIFPLLIFWSDAFSLFGAMLLSKLKLGVGYLDFMTRIRDTVGAKQMLLGLYKAPVFAILIALVGCFQGFNVEANASSIGSQTTKSVVQALFLIIIADAAFSIIYSWLHL